MVIDVKDFVLVVQHTRQYMFDVAPQEGEFDAIVQCFFTVAKEAMKRCTPATIAPGETVQIMLPHDVLTMFYKTFDDERVFEEVFNTFADTHNGQFQIGVRFNYEDFMLFLS